jgi:hypothetical protein
MSKRRINVINIIEMAIYINRYWYYNGYLYPEMMTVFVALDPCTKQNGCLEVIHLSKRF